MHIDHFAEVNLAGFYELAQAFGGIEACVKSWNGGQNLHDANSGFNQPHAGYLHLAPRRRWRSCGSGTTCPTATWTAPTGSRRSSTT